MLIILELAERKWEQIHYQSPQWLENFKIKLYKMDAGSSKMVNVYFQDTT